MSEAKSTNEWLEIIRRVELTPLQTRLLAIVAGAGPLCSDQIAEYHRRLPEQSRYVVMNRVEWETLEKLRDKGLIVLGNNGWQVTTDPV